jgi:hypothetical protein
VSAEALAAPLAPGLVGRLAALVRPEFRVEVLVPAVGDPILGSPACVVPGCVRSSRYGGLCPAHLGRWRKAGRPERGGVGRQCGSRRDGLSAVAVVSGVWL